MLYFLALVCLSTSPNWAKLNQMPAEVLGFWRLSIAAALLAVYLLSKKSFTLLNYNKKNKWVFISGFFMFLHLWTYKYAAKTTLISNVMVLFASNPIWASVGGALFFKEKLHIRTYISYFLATLSIIFLVYQNLNFSSENVVGNIVSLLSAFFYAAFMLSGKKARLIFDVQTTSFYQYFTCASFFFITSVVTQKNFIQDYESISWISVLGLVALPTFLGHFLLTKLVSQMDISVLTCGKLIEPLFASLWAYWLFKENISSSVLISFALIIIAVLILFWPQLKENVKLRIK